MEAIRNVLTQRSNIDRQQRTKHMSIFETVGEAALLRAEGDKHLAASLSGLLQRLRQSVINLFGKIFVNLPDQHPLP
jgi:hypothetical protein